MNEHELTVMVHIDGRLFRNFALFDTFRRQRKWVSPALFAAIMIGFSCVCFALRGQAEQAVLLGGTLLACFCQRPISSTFFSRSAPRSKSSA